MALTQSELQVVLRNLPKEYLEAYQNGDITDEELEPFARRLGVKKPEPVKKAAPPVSRPLDSGSALGSLADKAQAGMQRVAAGDIQRGEDAAYLREREESKPWYRRDVLDFVGLGPDERAQADAAIARMLSGTGNLSNEAAKRQLVEQAAANERAAAQQVENTGLGQGLLRTAQDVAGSPESSLSVFGGITAALPAWTSYSREYLAAREAGLDPDAANRHASAIRNVEAGMGAIPLGRAIPGLNRLGRSATSLPGRVAGRVAGNAAGEGVNEAATEVALWGTNAARRSTETDAKAREFADTQLPKDIADGFERMTRAAAAGALGGGAMSAPSDTMQVIAERGREAADALARQTRERADASRAEQRSRVRTENISEAERPRDLFGIAPEQPAPAAEVPETNFADPAARIDYLNRSIGEDRDALERLTAEFGQVMGTMDGSRDPALLEQITSLRNRIATKEQAVGRAVRQLPKEQGDLFGGMGVEQPRSPAFRGDGTDRMNPQPRDPDRYYGEGGNTVSRSREQALFEARKMREKAEQQAANKAEGMRKRAERTAGRNLIAEAQSLPAEQRDAFIADGLAEWRANNPVENFVTTTPAQRNNVRTGRTSAPALDSGMLNIDQLREAAGPDTTLGRTKAIILSGGTGADKALEEGRTWLSADGRRKYEISDHQSRVTMPESVSPNAEYRAADILQHEELYREFPQLRDVPVRFDYDEQTVYGGSFREPDEDHPLGLITINLADVAEDGRVSGFDSYAHRNLIHEMQHAAQSISGTTGGSSPEKFLSALGRKLVRDISELEGAINFGKENGVDVSDLEAEVERAQREYDVEFNEAMDKYKKVLGEQEAYSSVARMSLTGQERQDDTLTREQSIINRDGGTYSPRGKLLARPNQKEGKITNPSNGIGMLSPVDFKGAKTAKALLSKYLSVGTDPALLGLARTFAASRWIGDVKVEMIRDGSDVPANVATSFNNGAGALASFNEAGEVTLYFRDDKANAFREEILVHEVVHALTEAALDRNPELRKELEAIARQIGYSLSDIAGFSHNPEKDNMRDFWKHAVRGDAGELLAYGLTSPKFREVLSRFAEDGRPFFAYRTQSQESAVLQRPDRPERVTATAPAPLSLWQKFVDFARKVLGLQPRHQKAFDDALAAYHEDSARYELELKEHRTMRPLAAKLEKVLDTLLQDAEEHGIAVDLTAKAPLANMSSITLTARENMLNPDNRVMKFMRGAFGGFGNLGRELATIKEMADGFAAIHSHNAANHFHTINRGIEMTAKLEHGAGKYKTLEEAQAGVRKEVEGLMDKMAAAPTEQDRISMMNAMVRRYPDLDGFPKAVQEVQQLSRTLLRQLIDTNPNPTPDQLRLMNTIMANSFRYTTRMYAAFQGTEGRIHSERIVKEYKRARKLVNEGKAVPAKYKDSYETYTNAADYLINNDLYIPEQNEIGALSTDRLGMLFDTWVGNASNVKAIARAEAKAQGYTERQADQYVREAMIAGLLDRRETVNAAQYQGKADDLIIGMLGLADTGGPFVSYYRGFKQDRSILEQREQLPQEIRDLFGEIKDPATRLAITIAKQGELAGRTRMLLDMRDRGLGKWVIAPQDAGLPGNEAFTAELAGEGYGPLNGYRTRPEIAAAIGDSLEMFSEMGDAIAKSYQNSDAFATAAFQSLKRGVVKLAAFQKLMTVVVDLYNLGSNALGSPIALMANGVWNPRYWYGGAEVAAQVIWDTATDGSVALSEAFEDAVRYGMLDSARVQEIRRTPQQFVRTLISSTPESLRKAGSVASRTKRAGIEAFAMADAWVKIAAFQERVDTLRKFYAAEGIQKTDHELKTEAADQTKDTNITYARTGAVIRGAEKIGLTTFMPYFVSVPRAITYNYVQGVKDIIRATDATTVEGRMAIGMAGMRRLAGATGATYGLVYAMKAIAAAVNGEDEEKVRHMQKLMFPDARFADSFYLGKAEDGTPLFARFSRVDPYGPLNDFLRILIDEETSPEDKRRFAAEMLRDMVITNRVVVAGGLAVTDILTDETLKDKGTKLERIAPKAAENMKDWMIALPGVDYSDANSVLRFMDGFVPGIADMFDVRNSRPTDAKDEYAERIATMIYWSGGRLDRADPGMAAYTAGKKVKDARDQGRRRQSDGLKAGEDVAELQSRFLEDAEGEFLAMREASEVYDAMIKGLNYTPRQAGEVLKESASLQPVDIGNIRSGRLSIEAEQWINKYSRIISEKSQKERGADAGKELTPERKKQIKEYLRNMRALGYKVQE